MAPTTHVAVDIGTSSATVTCGTIGQDALDVSVVHRFDSRLLDDDNRREWELPYLLAEIRHGLAAVTDVTTDVESVGIDGTAAGFGLLADGEPLGNPMRWGTARPEEVSARDAFERLGHWRLPVTYYYLTRERPELVEQADTLLLAPQLLGYLLGGDPVGEVTYAISAGLGNARTTSWATDLLGEWGLRTDILPDMADHGTAAGRLDEHPFDRAPAVRTVAGHDTSSAVAAIPFGRGDRAFLATGSWFIPGLELAEPVIAPAAFDAGAENVGGVAGTSRFVRNLKGFSILERWRRERMAAGADVEYDTLLAGAERASPLETIVATTDNRLQAGGESRSVAEGITAIARETDQRIPGSDGAVARCLFESLAVESAVVLERLCELADAAPDELYLVGGGAHNGLLCQFVADATGLPVHAGAPDATALGNLLVQAVGATTLASIAEGRALVDEHVPFTTYHPTDPAAWADAAALMRSLLGYDDG